MAPVVIGPGGHRYLIDHHHLARALYDEGVGNVFVAIVADFHQLDGPTFWNIMDFHGWTHPFDGKGRRRDFADLPKTIKDMEDDPYRSLAGELRSVGGFAKDITPFSEFIWADFLRPRIKAKELHKDFDTALERATALRQDRGRQLPARLVRAACQTGAAAAATSSKGRRRQRAPPKRKSEAARAACKSRPAKAKSATRVSTRLA